MLMKKMLPVVSSIFLGAVMLCAEASAENDGDWCSGVTAMGAGANSSSKIALLVHSRSDCGSEWPSGTPRWFILDDSQGTGSAMLATVLTAKTTNSKLIIVGKNKRFDEWNVLEYLSLF